MTIFWQVELQLLNFLVFPLLDLGLGLGFEGEPFLVIVNFLKFLCN